MAALGRIEPHQGVIHVNGPPWPAVVIERLSVEEGDRVERGEVIAVLAGIGLQRAEVARTDAELKNAAREVERNRELKRKGVLPDSGWEAILLARDIARANLDRAEADLELSLVRSPIDGQMLEIHAREGERVGADGFGEIGDTSVMYAVAEVYETDIGRVRTGQRAKIRSPALPRELDGTVERVGLKIGKKDVLSTDPVADADARVVEVHVALYVAEGSDWFWCLGADQDSGSDDESDDLFRSHLKNIYLGVGATPPADLDRHLVPHAVVWTFARQVQSIQPEDHLAVVTNCRGRLAWQIDAGHAETALLETVGGVMAGAQRYSSMLGPRRRGRA